MELAGLENNHQSAESVIGPGDSDWRVCHFYVFSPFHVCYCYFALQTLL